MEKIPQQAAYSGKRIVLYGPESTGKSTLSRKLAQHYNTVLIEEFAREYLQDKFNHTGEVCSYDDILPIAIGQRNLENNAVNKAQDYLFCDTDVLETYVYCMAYFNQAPQELINAVEESSYELYLLLQVDVPWTPDDLRDRPERREEMFELFLAALNKFNKPYKIVDGLDSQRFENAIKAIENESK
ncbi:ribosylnicotinamide kinase [Nonlabens ulvanivorans]|uniref:Ribosylnicotinamide kinase n=1 Tax=Nonlabens ulvanivorans TaxID=906888 RepID=A0A090Q5R0_NONUL|nr:ATP-binding protein [Nonlabens ulvanivorans]GAK98429.1 ribosylnicotinamide kinase [Nonlabens ulvanivorans]